MITTKPKILVDIDLTVVDTLAEWISWWENRVMMEFPWEDLKYKSPADIMSREIKEPMEFWEDPRLYDYLEPEHGSAEALSELNRDYDIVFCSKSVPEHIRSKDLFIEQCFPYAKGVIHTSEKHLVQADVFIDDHDTNCLVYKQHHPDAVVIHRKTVMNWDDDLHGINVMYDWRDLPAILGMRGEMYEQ